MYTLGIVSSKSIPIAKGYAVDCAIDALRAGGCYAGLVNAGGDLRVFGDATQTVIVRVQGHMHALALNNAAIAISDPHSQQAPGEHCGYYRRNAVVRNPDFAALSPAPHAERFTTRFTPCTRIA